MDSSRKDQRFQLGRNMRAMKTCSVLAEGLRLFSAIVVVIVVLVMLRPQAGSSEPAVESGRPYAPPILGPTDRICEPTEWDPHLEWNAPWPPLSR
jgi:hypothetical protein